jgi:hypothetical protein
MIYNWKRQLLDGASELFERGAKSSATEPETSAQIDELYRQIDKLQVEWNFLANRSARLGLLTEKPW